MGLPVLGHERRPLLCVGADFAQTDLRVVDLAVRRPNPLPPLSPV